MKALFRSFVLEVLTACARARLARMRRNGVKVIGVTGSIGKTTCKEAIAHVLGGQLHVLSSVKSYNTEFGLPLTILELTSEFSLVIGWMKNLILAVWMGIFARANYDILILEMGVDKPGDMDQLVGVIGNLDVGVFTGVHPVHMADGQFADMDAIFQEKAKLVKAVRSNGAVLLNYDDARCKKLGEEMSHSKNNPKIIMYGTSEVAKLSARNIHGDQSGLDFEVRYGEVRQQIHTPILGKQHISSLLPAIGCGLFLGMYMGDIAKSLKTFALPPGRLSAIDGVNGSLIIDSSYNASPDAVRAAVNTLCELAEEMKTKTETGSENFCARRIFVFGNMNELGEISEREHKNMASFLNGKIDVLVTVGDMAKLCALEIEKHHAQSMKILSFHDAIAAAEYLKPKLRNGDIVLVKGSQNKVRLERAVKALMQDPSRAQSLLARQDWADA